MDFKARANMASVKNFQLIASPPVEAHQKKKFYESQYGKGMNRDETAHQPVILQMGKVGKNCFNMDYQFPMSMFQAFAICVARFDTSAVLH